MEKIKPLATYKQWEEQPSETHGEVNQQIDGLWPESGLLSALLVAGSLGLAFTKYIPGWGPLVHKIGSSALKLFKPNKVEKAEKKAKVIEETAWKIIEQIESLPSNHELVKQLKAKIKESTPDEFETIFAAWKREKKNQ